MLCCSFLHPTHWLSFVQASVTPHSEPQTISFLQPYSQICSGAKEIFLHIDLHDCIISHLRLSSVYVSWEPKIKSLRMAFKALFPLVLSEILNLLSPAAPYGYPEPQLEHTSCLALTLSLSTHRPPAFVKPLLKGHLTGQAWILCHSPVVLSLSPTKGWEGRVGKQNDQGQSDLAPRADNWQSHLRWLCGLETHKIWPESMPVRGFKNK